MRPPTTGGSTRYEHMVAAADTAEHRGNELPAPATPVLPWLSEITAMRDHANRLQDGAADPRTHAPRPRFGRDQPPRSVLRCPCHALPLAGGPAQVWCSRSGRSWHADDPVLWPRAA